MKSICIVLAAGIVAALALAIVPSTRADEVDAFKTANNSKQLNRTLCFSLGKEKNFPNEGVTCKCKGILFFGRWECKPSSNSTTTTTTAAPTTVPTDGTTGNTEVPTNPSTQSTLAP